MERTELSSAPAARLLDILRSNADPLTREVTLPNRELADLLGVRSYGTYGRRSTTVTRALRALEDSGFVARRFDRGRRILVVS